VVYFRAMELPPDAARALESVRRTGRDVRFEIRKACEQQRWRLKVLYRAPDPATGLEREVQVGLLWSEDRSGLEALARQLEGVGT
jgi:hypothetical protein